MTKKTYPRILPLMLGIIWVIFAIWYFIKDDQVGGFIWLITSLAWFINALRPVKNN
ncbi:hypothetical protein KJ840_02890 [Patescibacteria group bacterium]|nr:hypothetical protein [Patescibacteria group bacterium]